jgi:hypothetical protein
MNPMLVILSEAKDLFANSEPVSWFAKRSFAALRMTGVES